MSDITYINYDQNDSSFKSDFVIIHWACWNKIL